MTTSSSVEVTESPPPSKLRCRLRKWGSVLYDKKNKTVCGRGFLAWAQISLFYCIFYAFLAGFFISMLFVVYLVTPTDRPLYYMGESAMATIYSLNPGVGFRPQPDVSSEVIKFDAKNNGTTGSFSYLSYVADLDNYLNQYYKWNDGVEQCSVGQPSSSGEKSCEFSIERSIAGECTSENGFGYPQGRPCVLIKLNRLYGWKSGGMSRCPEDDETSDGKGNLGTGGDVRIKCVGELDADRDNLLSTRYYSYNGQEDKCGSIPNNPSYYPFSSQLHYQTPYVWVQFETKPDTLVSVLCRAYGDNIDNKSKLPMRGMARIKIFVKENEKPIIAKNIVN